MYIFDVFEDMRDALEDTYQHGRVERSPYMHLLDLIDEAEQEADRLDGRMRADRYTHAHMVSENYDLKAENAKLRELASGLSSLALLHATDHVREQYEKRMRELGI